METSNTISDTTVESNESDSKQQQSNDGNKSHNTSGKMSLSDKARALSEGKKEDTNDKNENKEVINNLKKFKLKVDGEEFEQEFDLSDEESLKTHFQLSLAAKKRMAEASRQKQEITQILNQLKNDPFSLLKDNRILGEEKLIELSEKMLAERIRQASMTEEEKKLYEADQIISQHKARQEQEKIAKEKEEKEAQVNQWRMHYEKMIIEALDSVDKELKTPETVSLMAKYIFENDRDGLGLTPLQIANFIKKEKEKEEKKYESIFNARNEAKRKADIAALKSNGKFGVSQFHESSKVESSNTFMDPLTFAEQFRMGKR